MYLALAVHCDVSKGQPLHDNRQCALLSLQVSSQSSQATKDSGLGLKYTASTPLRKPQPGQQEEKNSSGPLPASGYWVYSPIRSTLRKSLPKRGRPHHIQRAASLSLAKNLLLSLERNRCSPKSPLTLILCCWLVTYLPIGFLSRAAFLNLRVTTTSKSNDLFTGVAYQLSCISDLYN